MLIRAKTPADAAGCLELLLRVHKADGYPLHLDASEVGDFLVSEHETGAWVAEADGALVGLVGHVALHWAADDPTIEAAAAATGLPVARLAMVSRLFVAPQLRRSGLGRALLRHAAGKARSRGLRAVLDVGQALLAPIALYEAEGWTRVGELHLPLDPDTMLDLWVYVSPA